MQKFDPDRFFIIKASKKLGKIREKILGILGFEIYDFYNAVYVKIRHKDGHTYRVQIKEKEDYNAGIKTTINRTKRRNAIRLR